MNTYVANPAIFDHPTPKCINYSSHVKMIASTLKDTIVKEGLDILHAKHLGIIESLWATREGGDIYLHLNPEFMEADGWKEMNLGMTGYTRSVKGKRPTFLRMQSEDPFTREVKKYTFTNMPAALAWDMFQLHVGDYPQCE